MKKSVMKNIFSYIMLSLLIVGCTEIDGKDNNVDNEIFDGQDNNDDDENFDCRFDYFYESYEYIGSDYVKSDEYRSFFFTKDSNNGNITSAEAQTLYGEYKFSSVGDWQITGGESWCTISPTSGSSTEGDMQISFTQNSNAKSRSARFQITHNSDTHQFTITQNGFPNDIHVDTPGTLPLLVEKSVQTMNVSGELNSIDYDFIEAMPNLRSLRMADVIGTKSFYLNASHSNITCLILPNELKEISFVCVPLVQELHIPAGVETILSGFDIKFLKHVIFEKNSQLKKISDSAFISLYELYEIDMSACTQLESIAELTFWKDKNLRKVKIGAKVPPQIGFSTFEGINPYAELYVPAESINAYKEAGWWQYFYSISALD